jgi:hypothetical protein
VTAPLAELLEALDLLRERVYRLRWQLEAAWLTTPEVLAEVREVELALDDLRALVRAAERPGAAPPTPQPRPAERRSSGR